jgi:hypothetical protein
MVHEVMRAALSDSDQNQSQRTKSIGKYREGIDATFTASISWHALATQQSAAA